MSPITPGPPGRTARTPAIGRADATAAFATTPCRPRPSRTNRHTADKHHPVHETAARAALVSSFSTSVKGGGFAAAGARCGRPQAAVLAGAYAPSGRNLRGSRCTRSSSTVPIAAPRPRNGVLRDAPFRPLPPAAARR